MKKSQGGFTLIELVVVIVLLGILGVTALGKFQNLSDDASDAATQGVASEISAGSAINFAEGVVQNPAAYPVPIAGASCTNALLAPLLASGVMPTGITVSGAAVCAGAGGSIECTFTHANGTTPAVVGIICTG